MEFKQYKFREVQEEGRGNYSHTAWLGRVETKELSWTTYFK